MFIEINALKKQLYYYNSIKNVKIFYGSNADASPEEIAREMNKYFAEMRNYLDESDTLSLDSDDKNG